MKRFTIQAYDIDDSEVPHKRKDTVEIEVAAETEEEALDEAKKLHERTVYEITSTVDLQSEEE